MKYFRPNTLEEFIDYSTNLNDSYNILAGGTDLVPYYEQGNSLPDHLIDIKNITELHGIREEDNHIEIGALTAIETIKKSDLIKENFGDLMQASRLFAGVQIRHRGTLGGNICNASPAGDLLPSLYAHKAELRIVGPKKLRSVPISSFIIGPGKVDLEPFELLQSVILPKTTYLSFFEKLGLRQAMAISVVNFSVVYDFDHEEQKFNHLSIAAGAVAPTVVYLRSLSDAIMKENMSIEEAIALVDKDINPIDDIRATASYRRAVLKNLLKYRLQEIIGHE